ncbi:unnamed protein product, partial [Symbiodinium microadriaticum]
EVDPEASKIFSAVGSHVICVEGREEWDLKRVFDTDTLGWSNELHGRKISFRMGICRGPPRLGYLGKSEDEFSFWWDDGDIYHQ